MNKNAVLKKTGKFAASATLYVFITICILGVLMILTGKTQGDDALTLFGKQMRIVVSDSMAECDATDVSKFDIKDIPIKSMVFIDAVPSDEKEAEKWYSELEVGDVLTFKYRYTEHLTITHRITNIEKKPGGGYLIDLKGDNKNSNSDTMEQTIDTSVDNPDPFNYVIGKVIGQNYPFGVFVTSLKSPVGIVCIIIIPSLIILILEIFKIIKILDKSTMTTWTE